MPANGFQVLSQTYTPPSGYTIAAMCGETTGSAALAFTMIVLEDGKLKVGVVNGSSQTVSGNATINIFLKRS